MLFSQLSALKELLNNYQLDAVDNYLSSVSRNSKILASKFAITTSMDIALATSVLKILLDNGFITSHVAIRCSQCDLLLKRR